MKNRPRDYAPIRRVLAFANTEPEHVWNSYQTRCRAAGVDLRFERSDVAEIHSRVAELLEFLQSFTQWSLGLPKPWLPHRTGSLDDRLTISEGHATATLTAIKELRGLEAKFDAATDLLTDEVLRNGMSIEAFHMGLALIVDGATNRILEIHVCARNECNNFFIEDRQIARPSQRQQFCRSSCRQRANNERRRAEDPDYFRRAKRRSRERAKRQS